MQQFEGEKWKQVDMTVENLMKKFEVQVVEVLFGFFWVFEGWMFAKLEDKCNVYREEMKYLK